MAQIVFDPTPRGQRIEKAKQKVWQKIMLLILIFVLLVFGIWYYLNREKSVDIRAPQSNSSEIIEQQKKELENIPAEQPIISPSQQTVEEQKRELEVIGKRHDTEPPTQKDIERQKRELEQMNQ